MVGCSCYENGGGRRGGIEASTVPRLFATQPCFESTSASFGLQSNGREATSACNLGTEYDGGRYMML